MLLALALFERGEGVVEGGERPLVLGRGGGGGTGTGTSPRAPTRSASTTSITTQRPRASKTFSPISWAYGRREGVGDLIELDVQHEWVASSYVGLARSSTHLGNHDHAIYGLNDIDRRFPPTTPTARGERNYVRARALIGRPGLIIADEPLSEARLYRLAGLPHTRPQSMPERPNRRPAQLRRLESARDEECTVVLSYGDGASAPARVEVLPRLLYRRHKHGYLEGECQSSGTLRTYRLDRIQRIETQ